MNCFCLFVGGLAVATMGLLIAVSKDFFANHPFIYYVLDKQGIVLFNGKLQYH